MAMEKNAATQIKINGANGITTSATASSPAVGVLVANENCYVTQTPTTLLESLPYYYGCITREDAEWILYDEGCPDGMYLLRESGNDFVLSLCHHQSVLHYRINKLPSGDVVLQGLPNQTFQSPMELIEAVDGLACKPTRPLKAMFGKCLPPTHWKLDEESIREQLIQRAQNWGMTQEEMREMLDCDLHFQPTLSPMIRSLINKSMHELQPWYHYRLSRNEAERRIESSGHLDGKFLVRERDESSYAICLSHDSRVKHYRIDILPSGNFAIQDGPKFESLIALISHYTIFSGGLWCMLDEGCARPQEMIRQYAEQSNAQMSMVQMNNHPHHHHLPHPHPLDHHHHHHNHPNLDPYQVQNNNNNDHHHQVVWAVHRGHDPLEFNEKCKACLQLFPANRHRNRRVSTPTNLKLKEWFTTINHKWARIKRQVILHHQRQQPLINEDNYGTTTNNEMACCHVSKIKTASKAKNLKELLLNGRNEPSYRFNLQSNLPFQCKCYYNNNNNNSTFNNNHQNNNNNHHHHHHHHRYLNGYGTARYAYRKQQFGRWHEEPAFGSRYAFDNEPFRQANSVTNTPNSKPNRLTTMAQNNDNNNMNLSDNNQNDNNNNNNVNNVNNGKLTTTAAATGTGTAADKIIDKLNGDGGDPDENLHRDESEMNGANRPALIKSSSIDTIAAFFNDPIEEIRRLHFRPMMDEPNPTGLFCSSTMRNSNELARTNRPFVDPELLQLRTTCNKENGVNNNKLLLQRTNSFDGMTNNSMNLVNHCTIACNCSDWLLDFDIDINDPFQSLPEADLAKTSCLNFNDDEMAMKELTNVFNNASATKALSQGSGGGGAPFLMNGFSKDSDNSKLNGFPNGQPSPSSSFGKGSSADLKTALTMKKEPRARRATSQTRPFVNLNGPLNSGEDELVKQDNIIIDNNIDNNIDNIDNKNHHHLNKTTIPVLSGTTSSSSSSNSGGSSSSMSISSSGGNSSTGSGGGGGGGGGGGAVGVRVHFGGSNRSFGTASTMTMKSLKHQSDNVDQKKSNNNNNNSNNTGPTIKNGHLSFHSTSLHLNSDLMDSNFFSKNKCDDINHSNSSSSTSSSPSSMSLTMTTTTTAATNKTNITTAPTFCTNNNNLLNDKMPTSATVSDSLNCIGDNGIIGEQQQQQQCSAKPTKISNRLPIIDLLKEFDVCFNNQDNIDDDSSTLTDNSSHSSNCKRDNDTTTDDCPKNCPKSSNDAQSNINHKSSSSTLSSSYHHSSLPPPTISPPPPPTSFGSMISEQQWPNGMATTIDSTPPSSSTPNKAANQQQQQQQQVPSGLNGNRNDSTIADAHRPTTTTTATTTTATTTEQCLKDIELICLNEVIEEVQETIQKCKRGPICFDPRCITLKRRIGNGYFGDVFLASIPSLHISTNINLAVKMLKSHAVPQQKAEILREAQTMAKLDHRHIVRLIGVCENDPFMLVMELAPLGPLNKYLQNYGQNMSDEDVLKLMLQVAKAMQYLEDMNYVHRDLAARNILLVNEKFAKVSDFGMSRALGQGKDYYKARSASKWPLKWYAPECIYYYKFSSKSDVWSFGVALWEAMSRGEMPYQGMDGQDILRMFNENRRLPKPEHCSVIIYQIMWSCWQFKPEDRLNFANITEQLTHYLGGK